MHSIQMINSNTLQHTNCDEVKAAIAVFAHNDESPEIDFCMNTEHNKNRDCVNNFMHLPNKR